MANESINRRLRLSQELSQAIDAEALAENITPAELMRNALAYYLTHGNEIKAADSIALQRLEELIIVTEKGFRSQANAAQLINDKLDLNTQLVRNPDYLSDHPLNVK